LIPLSHTGPRRDDSQAGGWPTPPGRPVFRCLDCGRPLYVGEFVRTGRSTVTPKALSEPDVTTERARCPACGADRLVPLSFQVSRLDADDEVRPEVAAMRPIAKCGGCGARIYARKPIERRRRGMPEPDSG
jgi:DNA-directed RNA polymerase subunit RPC12/RpoP